MTLVYGIITGVLFGILLQRARVLRYDKQLGALRLKDMTIVKFMLSAVVVAMIGTYILVDAGEIELKIKSTSIGANVIGGLIFGLGWGLLGYCPGTSLGAVGEGRLDAIWGILGMLVGAGIFAEFYTPLKNTVYEWGKLGEITFPEILNVSHWIVVGAVFVLTLLLFVFFEKKKL